VNGLRYVGCKRGGKKKWEGGEKWGDDGWVKERYKRKTKKKNGGVERWGGGWLVAWGWGGGGGGWGDQTVVNCPRTRAKNTLGKKKPTGPRNDPSRRVKRRREKPEGPPA